MVPGDHPSLPKQSGTCHRLPDGRGGGDFRHEKNKAYHAFVKCNGDYTDLSIHDFHDFLRDVGGQQAEQFEALAEGWPGFHFFDKSDIHEALQKIYI